MTDERRFHRHRRPAPGLLPETRAAARGVGVPAPRPCLPLPLARKTSTCSFCRARFSLMTLRSGVCFVCIFTHFRARANLSGERLRGKAGRTEVSHVGAHASTHRPRCLFPGDSDVAPRAGLCVRTCTPSEPSAGRASGRGTFRVDARGSPPSACSLTRLTCPFPALPCA